MGRARSNKRRASPGASTRVECEYEYDSQANLLDQYVWDYPDLCVVVAAGNQGPAAGTITKPGDDPVVMTVGAYDDKGDDANHATEKIVEIRRTTSG